MFSIKIFFLILTFATLFFCAFTYRKESIIVVTQGVIENKNSFPINIYWYQPNFTKGDQFWFRFSNSEHQYTEHFEIESYAGTYEVPGPIIEQHNNPDEYCAAILSDGRTLDDNCLDESKIQWMYNRREALKLFSFRDLMIPGTHQSAAYAKSDNESLDDQSLISRWTLCQTKSIKSQLMDGIRYLDLRPGFLNKDGRKEYIITHNVFNLISMDDAVRQINDFMNISKDIVIVSFKEFSKGFQSNQDHMDFIAYLELSFSRHIHPYTTWTYSLNQFWRADKRLILSYHHETHKISKYMWSPTPQYWADVQTIGQLHSYLSKLHQDYRNDYMPFVAMVEFTHSATTIVQDVFKRDMSLRHWAEQLGKYIPQWYIEEWNATANIVAVDFYQTSGIVDIAIQLNERRASNPSFVYNRFRPLFP